MFDSLIHLKSVLVKRPRHVRVGGRTGGLQLVRRDHNICTVTGETEENLILHPANPLHISLCLSKLNGLAHAGAERSADISWGS